MSSARQLEARHETGSSPHWNESWYFDFADASGLGGYVRIGLLANQSRAWCWANLVIPGCAGPVVVRDHDVALPRGDALVARSEGLWCELTCETPMEHWSIGLEAFGVVLDEPADAYRGEIGERVAVGLDLEWERAMPAYHYPYPAGYPAGHYQHAGTVHGVVLVEDQHFDFVGIGERDHSWGERDWWNFGWNWAAVYFDETLALHLLLGDNNLFTEGYIWRGGDRVERVTYLDAEVSFDNEGLPLRADYVLNRQLHVTVEPLGCSPVPLLADDGRQARFPRALCAFTLDDGRRAHGWAEWLQVGYGRT